MTNVRQFKGKATLGGLVLWALFSTVSASDLVLVTSEENRTILQGSIGQQTNQRWQVKAYQGTDIQLVDDIRAQAVSSTLPEAAQIPGATIDRWAALGFIKNLDSVSKDADWAGRLPEQIAGNIRYRDVVYAVPTQVYRSNWMWLNRDVIGVDEFGEMSMPKTWQTFFELAKQSNKSGKDFILQVDDPMQNTLILESIMLGLKGPDFYKKSFVDLDFTTLKSQDMIDVFTRLAELRPYLQSERFSSWQAASEALVAGKGSVMFAGDWVKPHLNNAEGALAENIECQPLPEAAATFLYNLNSVVFFKDTAASEAANLANVLFTESMLTDLNIREGSIPARLDISPWGFDRCSVRSMREFRSAHTINTLHPSLAAGMATLEIVQKSVYNAVDEFIANADMSPEQGARKMAKAIRVAVYKI